VNQTYKFLRNCINERIDNHIDDNIECLINVDETPCYIENPSKETIDIKGVKKVEIITYGKEKCRLTAILAISASGEKLPPMLILKGKTGKKKENILNNLDLVKDKKIFVKCQDNSWCTAELFKFWIKDIFIPYQNNIVKKKCLLIFDRATTHLTTEILDYLQFLNIKYVLIPAGFTRFLQPLDVAINKPFKIGLKHKYLEFQQKNLEEIFQNKFSLKDEIIVKFIAEIWNDEKIIKRQTIIHSFLHCGISQLLDGSQDELFNWPDLELSFNAKNDIGNIINDSENINEEQNFDELS